MTSVHRHDDVRIYHKEAKSLRAVGCGVTILCPDYEGEDENGIRFVRVRLPAGRFRRILAAPGRFCRAAKEADADFYHFHDPELLRAGLMLRRWGKTVYDVHEDVPLQILTKPYLKPVWAGLASRLFGWYEGRAARRLWGIVAAEPGIYVRMKRFNRNTCQVCNYPMPKELAAASPRPGGREKAVCYIGSITRIRGIFEMLEAAESAGARLLLAGDFETEELRREAELHPGWKNVEYLGYVGREEVKNILSRAAAGLVTLHPVPKYKTALPVKMFEYMAAGIPVIASDFPDWRRIVEESGCGLCVNPLNPDEIRTAVRYLLSSPDVAVEMGERGRRAVLRQYHWGEEAKKLRSFYGL